MGFRGNQNFYDMLNQCILFGCENNMSVTTSEVNYLCATNTSGNYVGATISSYVVGTPFYGVSKGNATNMSESDFDFTSYESTAIANTSVTMSSSLVSVNKNRTRTFTINITNSNGTDVTIKAVDLIKYINNSGQSFLIGTYFFDESFTVSAGATVTKVIEITTTFPTTDPELVS